MVLDCMYLGLCVPGLCVHPSSNLKFQDSVPMCVGPNYSELHEVEGRHDYQRGSTSQASRGRLGSKF